MSSGPKSSEAAPKTLAQIAEMFDIAMQGCDGRRRGQPVQLGRGEPQRSRCIPEAIQDLVASMADCDSMASWGQLTEPFKDIILGKGAGPESVVVRCEPARTSEPEIVDSRRAPWVLETRGKMTTAPVLWHEVKDDFGRLLSRGPGPAPTSLAVSARTSRATTPTSRSSARTSEATTSTPVSSTRGDYIHFTLFYQDFKGDYIHFTLHHQEFRGDRYHFAAGCSC